MKRSTVSFYMACVFGGLTVAVSPSWRVGALIYSAAMCCYWLGLSLIEENEERKK